MATKAKATRTKKERAELIESIYRHSPIKRGKIVVEDEYEPHTNYSKIMSKLYLGNKKASKDPEFFKGHKIKAVLNCTKDISNTFAGPKSDVEYMRIPINDSLKEIDIKKATEFMPAAVAFIHKHIVLQGDALLVNCYAGRQRSACMVVAYLMKHHSMDPTQACKFVMDRRPEAFHYGMSLNFSKSIQNYYETHCKPDKKMKTKK